MEACSSQLHLLQLEKDGRIADLTAEVRIKSFETQRLQSMMEEARIAAKDSMRESERQRSKVELVTKELFDVKHTLEQRVALLDLKNTELTERVTFFKEIERGLTNSAPSSTPPGSSIRAVGLVNMALSRQVIPPSPHPIPTPTH